MNKRSFHPLKRFKESILKALMYLSILLVMGSLVLIIVTNIINGGIVIIKNPSVFLTPPGPKYLLGGGGGFLHAILGSLYMVLPSTFIACTLAYFISLSLQTDYMKPFLSDKIRTFFDILWGIPSIIYGVFVLSILVLLHKRGNLFAAIITLSLLQLPIITRYMDEAMRSVSHGLREATYSLGTNRLETSLIVTKSALPGIISGILLGMGRAIGDAASVIFTAGLSNSMPKGLFHSATALPIIIFLQSSSYHPTVREHAYAASLMLVIIIVLLNILSRIFTLYFSKYIRK